MKPSKTKIVYKFDEYGCYVGESSAQYDPFDGSLLLPPNCVEFAPEPEDPTSGNSYFIISDDRKSWQEHQYPTTAEELVGIFIPHEEHCVYAETLRKLMRKFTDENNEYQIVYDDDLTLTVEKIEKTEEETIYETFQEEVNEFEDSLSDLKDSLLIALLSDDQEKVEEIKTKYKSLISEMEAKVDAIEGDQ